MEERSEPDICIWSLSAGTAEHILPLEWESVQEKESPWINGILV